MTIHEETRSDVWLADAERGALSRLTFEGHNIEPVFTPDGRQVTYAAGGRGPLNLFSVPADGSGAPARLLASPLSQYPTSWSADGRVLVYTELHPETGADLWALTRGEARPRPLLRTKFDEDLGMLSPDGRWLAYESNEAKRWEVYVRPWPALSPRWQVSTEGGSAPLWSPRRPDDLLRLGGRHAARGGRRGGAGFQGLAARAWPPAIRRARGTASAPTAACSRSASPPGARRRRSTWWSGWAAELTLP